MRHGISKLSLSIARLCLESKAMLLVTVDGVTGFVEAITARRELSKLSKVSSGTTAIITCCITRDTLCIFPNPGISEDTDGECCIRFATAIGKTGIRWRRQDKEDVHVPKYI
jgi:hypothetical protein